MSTRTAIGTAGETTRRSDLDDRLAHLVLKPDWPRALCGYDVKDFLGTHAPAMDRCAECLRIAADRKLGRPGWDAP